MGQQEAAGLGQEGGHVFQPLDAEDFNRRSS